jgi:hypothetical protein
MLAAAAGMFFFDSEREVLFLVASATGSEKHPGVD